MEESAILSAKIKEEFRTFIIKEVRSCHQFVPKLREYQHSELTLMKELKKSWESFCLFKRWVSRLFHHHNKKVVNIARGDGKNDHTDAIGVAEFQAQVYTEFKKKILHAIQSLWADIRSHTERDSKLPLLASIFSLIEEMLYTGNAERKDFFERVKELVLRSSGEFFSQKLEEWNTDDCGSYFEMVARVSEEEEEALKAISRNCEELFFISKDIRHAFYEKLLVSYKKTLANSPFGFSYLITSKSYSVDLHNRRCCSKSKDSTRGTRMTSTHCTISTNTTFRLRSASSSKSTSSR